MPIYLLFSDAYVILYVYSLFFKPKEVKMKRFLILFFCVILVLSLSACGNDDENTVQELQSQIETLEQEKASLEREVDSLKKMDVSDNSLLSRVLWGDSADYYVDDEEFNFYSDCYCSNKIETPVESLRFYNPTALRFELDNGNMVYFTLSNEGIVYSVNMPRFSEIEK